MEDYMSIAIGKAKEGKTPFGALIVQDGEVLSAVHNTVRQTQDPTAHAEVNAIRQACRKIGSSKLHEAILYTTCEPCPMCAAAAFFAGIRHIRYGASIPTISRFLPQIHMRAQNLLEHSDTSVKIIQEEDESTFEELLKQYS